MKHSLIIPVYNEAPIIAHTLISLLSRFDEQKEGEWEIIVVDNASNDGTSEEVMSLGDARVRLLRLDEKGKGRAVREGFKMAKGSVVGFTDADLSVEPLVILNAYDLVKEDPETIILGSRFHPDSLMPGRESWRIANSRFFNYLARSLVRVDSSDAQCPLKVMSKEIAGVMLETREETWFFDLEFLALCKAYAQKTREIPVLWDEHRYPFRRSKLGVGDGARAIAAMFRIRSRAKKLTSGANLSKISSMKKRVIAGLGNPGGEYKWTRHNAGRIILDEFREVNMLPDWEYKKNVDALVSKGEVDGTVVTLIEPETYMNLSGASLKGLIKNPDDAAGLIVVHDDIDLPLGSWKISWDRGEGGHNGLKSITETLKTKKFLRIRIGILPVVGGVKMKPKGDDAVAEFVVGKFRPEEREQLARVGKEIVPALKELLSLTPEEAMNKWNKK